MDQLEQQLKSAITSHNQELKKIYHKLEDSSLSNEEFTDLTAQANRIRAKVAEYKLAAANVKNKGHYSYSSILLDTPVEYDPKNKIGHFTISFFEENDNDIRTYASTFEAEGVKPEVLLKTLEHLVEKLKSEIEQDPVRKFFDLLESIKPNKK